LYGDLSFKFIFEVLILKVGGLEADYKLFKHQLREHYHEHGNEGATLVKGLASDENDEKGYQNEKI